ncbi:MAG: hypothetical protein Q9166_007869 [cf. Caloplaca sp. 2 TL-2023]
MPTYTSSSSNPNSAHSGRSTDRHYESTRRNTNDRERGSTRHTALAPIHEGTVASQRGSYTGHDQLAMVRRTNSRAERTSTAALADDLALMDIRGTTPHNRESRQLHDQYSRHPPRQQQTTRNQLQLEAPPASRVNGNEEHTAERALVQPSANVRSSAHSTRGDYSTRGDLSGRSDYSTRRENVESRALPLVSRRSNGHDSEISSHHRGTRPGEATQRAERAFERGYERGIDAARQRPIEHEDDDDLDVDLEEEMDLYRTRISRYRPEHQTSRMFRRDMEEYQTELRERFAERRRRRGSSAWSTAHLSTLRGLDNRTIKRYATAWMMRITPDYDVEMDDPEQVRWRASSWVVHLKLERTQREIQRNGW